MINWKYSSWNNRWYNIDRFDHIGLQEDNCENETPFAISAYGEKGIWNLGIFDTQEEALKFLEEFMDT